MGSSQADKMLSRSTLEFYAGVVIAIVSVVFPVTSWLKICLILTLSGIVIDLIIRSSLTIKWHWFFKTLFSFAAILLLVAISWNPIKEQWIKDHPLKQTEQPKQPVGKEIVERPVPQLVKPTKKKETPLTELTPDKKTTSITLSHVFSLCGLPNRSMAPYYVEVKDITTPSSISIVVANTSNGVIVDQQDNKYCLHYSFIPIVGHSYTARFKDSSSPALQGTDFLNEYQPSHLIQSESQPSKESPAPNLASIRIASQKQIVSTESQFPYGLEVILQTDTVIEPVAFEIEFSGEIKKGQAFFQGYNIYILSSYGVTKQHPNSFTFVWQSPAFTPAKPITINVFSKSYVKAIEFRKIEFQYPLF